MFNMFQGKLLHKFLLFKNVHRTRILYFLFFLGKFSSAVMIVKNASFQAYWSGCKYFQTWKWVAAGLTVYTVDLGFRLFRRQNHVELLDFQAYNCDILYLKLLKEDFKAKPGQVSSYYTFSKFTFKNNFSFIIQFLYNILAVK